MTCINLINAYTLKLMFTYRAASWRETLVAARTTLMLMMTGEYMVKLKYSYKRLVDALSLSEKLGPQKVHHNRHIGRQFSSLGKKLFPIRYF